MEIGQTITFTPIYKHSSASAIIELLQIKYDYYQSKSVTLLNYINEHDNFGEVEVHDLRVATRRLTAFIDFINNFYSSPYLQQINDILKKQRKIFNSLRDTQVQIIKLSKWIYTYPVLYTYYISLLKLESKQVRKSTERIEYLSTTDIEGMIYFFSLDFEKNRYKFESEYLPFDYLNNVIAESLLAFDKSDTNALDSVHEARIEFKKLRYTLEILAELYDIPPEALQKLKDFQEVMGELQDNSVFNDELNKYIIRQHQIPENDYKQVLKRIIRDRNSLLKIYLKRGEEFKVYSTSKFLSP